MKKIKPDFKALGPKLGKNMKAAAQLFACLNQQEIAELEQSGQLTLQVEGESFTLLMSDVEILTQDLPGWQMASDGNYTVALDVTLNHELISEGLAREFVNKIQNLRKEQGFEVTDRIEVFVKKQSQLNESIENFQKYICDETLTQHLELIEAENWTRQGTEIEMTEQIKTLVYINKANLSQN